MDPIIPKYLEIIAGGLNRAMRDLMTIDSDDLELLRIICELGIIGLAVVDLMNVLMEESVETT